MKNAFLALLIFLSLKGEASIDTLHWEKKATLPDSIPREDFGHFVIDSFFYIVGGINSNYTYLNQVWRYEIVSDHWDRMNDFPSDLIAQSAGFSIDGKGYICCGVDTITHTFSNKLWEYDPIRDTWIRKADFPGWPRASPSSFTYAGKAYVGLGWIGIPENDLWRYNPSTDNWDMMDSIPAVGIDAPGLVIMDSFAYCIDGRLYNNGFSRVIWRYNIPANRWDSLGLTPPGGEWGPLCWGFKPSIIKVYGVLNPDPALSFSSNSYLYNIIDGHYDTLICNNFLDSVGGNGTFTYRNKGYFFGGYKTVVPGPSFYKDMWSFDASKFIHDTPTSIEETAGESSFKLYPSLISANSTLHVESSQEGQITFYNLLGQIVLQSGLHKGKTDFNCRLLNCQTDVILYKAQLDNGKMESSKIVTLK